MPDNLIHDLVNAPAVLTLKHDGMIIDEVLSLGEMKNAVTIRIGSKNNIVQWNGQVAQVTQCFLPNVRVRFILSKNVSHVLFSYCLQTVPELVAPNKYVMKYQFDGHDYVVSREITEKNELLDVSFSYLKRLSSTTIEGFLLRLILQVLDLDGGKVVAKFLYTKS